MGKEKFQLLKSFSNSAQLEDIASQIDGSLSASNFTEEFINSIGNAIPANRTITELKLSTDVLSDINSMIDKTRGLTYVKSVNLLNPDDFVNGGYYNTSGVWTVSALHKTSGFIPAQVGDSIYANSGNLTFWNIDRQYISGYNFGTSPTIAPTNTAYVRKSILTSNINTSEALSINVTLPSPWIPFSITTTIQESIYPIVYTSDTLAKFNTHKSNKNKFKANYPFPLDVKTSYTQALNQPTHPSVLYFESNFNGHKYWMAYTPYPNNASEYENPCIAYSDDGYTWSEIGITNPIAPKPSNGYNSDVRLALVGSNLECWWREVATGDVQTIVKKVSSDGINWGERIVINVTTLAYLSPSVIYEGGVYMVWFCRPGTNTLLYYESNDGINLTFIRTISVPTPVSGLYLWHGCVIKTAKGYEFTGYYGNANPANFIAYAVSADNITYSAPFKILENGYEGSWDSFGLYQPSFVRKTNTVMLYYGAQKISGTWAIGLVEAPSVKHLKALMLED